MCVFTKWYRFYLFTITFLICSLPSSRGQNVTEVKKGVVVKACVKKGEIILRWAPNNAIVWQFANQTGYTVEKYLAVKDGKALNKPIRKELRKAFFKPEELKNWESAVKIRNDKFAAIGAQAIYGETFQLDNKNTNIYQIINKAKELDSRFGFALFSADQSIETSELMGLRLTDKDVIKGERYIYRIFANIPLSKEKVDTGYVFVDADRITEYPMPKELKADFLDKMIKLTWDNRLFHDTYSGWFIERSEDKITWQPRNTEPFINLNNNGKTVDEITFIDTLPSNNKTYYFRIIGKSFFGVLSNPSKPTSGQGKPTLQSSPVITSVQEIGKNKIKVDWELPDEFSKNVLEFRLYRAPKSKGPYKKVKSALPKERSFMIINAMATNYFVIAALGVDSNEYKSLPLLFQLNDEDPPMPPKGLKGKIDTSGIVTLSWKKNKELDMYGYRVFVANSKNEEFSNLTNKIKNDTVFRDSITLHVLTGKIYYRVAALDNHYNVSEFSEILELKKPDKIAPTSPVFTSGLATDTAIYLKWINSSSEDVVGHVLFRTVAGADEWRVIAKFDTIRSKLNAIQAYTDSDKALNNKTYYEYAIIAIDNSKNESPVVQKFKTKLIDTGLRPAIKNISTDVNRDTKENTLRWDYNLENVDKILIYRKQKQEPLKLYKAVDGDQNFFSDLSLGLNTTYTYQLKARHKDGGNSPMSKEIIVQY